MNSNDLYDPSVLARFGSEQLSVVNHAGGAKIVDGPTRCGRTSALIAHVLALFLVETSEPLGANAITFIGASRHEALLVGEVIAAQTGGTTIRTGDINNLATDILADEPTTRSISYGEWNRVARELLERELSQPHVVALYWPESAKSLHSEAVRTNAVRAASELRRSGWPFAPANAPDDKHWQELLDFANRVHRRNADSGMADRLSVVELAIKRLRNGPFPRLLTNHSLVCDDLHRLDPLGRLLLGEIAKHIAPQGLRSLVLAGNSELANWANEIAVERLPVRAHSIHLPALKLPKPSIRLVRLRHRALEAEAIIEVVEQSHSLGVSYADIAIVVPFSNAPICEAIARVAARRGIPVRQLSQKVGSDPVILALCDLITWSLRREAVDLQRAFALGLIDSSKDERLNCAIPTNLRELAQAAFGLWERIVAPAVTRGQPSTAEGCRVVLRRLENTGLQNLQTMTQEELLSVIRIASQARIASIAGVTNDSLGDGSLTEYGQEQSDEDGRTDETDETDENDAVEIIRATDVGGRSWHTVVVASTVEGTWPRARRVVESGWDIRELAGSTLGLRHELDHVESGEQRAAFSDLIQRATDSAVAVAAPEPGVMVSRFVEGWPEARFTLDDRSTRDLHAITRSPETTSEIACFPETSLRLSATRLDAFENCPLNFAFQYVAGVRGPGGVPASVGTMVHSTLEAFLLPYARLSSTSDTDSEPDPDRSRDRLFALLDAHWDQAAFAYRPQEADYRRRAETWLENWYENELPKLGDVIAVEHRFTIDVGPHVLTGSIDRVSITIDGRVEIVDYKTGSPPLVRDRVDPDNLQLATYHLAAVTDPALQAFGDPEVLRLHFLTESVDVDQPIRPDHAERTRERILSTADDITSEAFEPSVKADCEYCNFKPLCPLQPEGRTIESTFSAPGPSPIASRSKPSMNSSMPYSVASTDDAPVIDRPDFIPLDEQADAITFSGSPLLIVAGAGSGKTTVLSKRIVHLVNARGWRPDQILGLTFSNKAAGNLRSAVARELGTGNDAAIMTYHGFGAQIIRSYGERVGLPPGPVLLDRARSWQLLLDSLNDVTIATRKTGKISSLVNEALSLASSCADHLVAIEAVLADCHRLLQRKNLHDRFAHALRGRIDLCEMAQAYERAKLAAGCIDFGDQVRFAVTLVESHSDIAAALRAQYPVALLDEYQDTNFAQRRLMQLLYQGSPELTAVGDDMQSIYAFRGAHIANLLEFETHFPGAVERRLETNHRSGPEIVRLAGHVQELVDNARPKDLLASGVIASATIERFVASNDFEEAELIAQKCIALHNSGQSWSDIAILCRKRRLIATISETLVTAGVPVEVIGLGGLLQRPEIIDLVAWLEIVAAAPERQFSSDGPLVGAILQETPAPDPSVSLLRVLRGEPYRLGLRDIAALARQARRSSHRVAHNNESSKIQRNDYDILDMIAAMSRPEDVPDLSGEAWTRVHAFNEIRHELVCARSQLTLIDLLERILQRCATWQRVDARGHENVVRFLDLAARFTPLPAQNQDIPNATNFGRRALIEFLEYLKLIALSEDELPEAVGSTIDAVHIMTVHQAKGLEFDTVFVPGLAGTTSSRSKIFPDGRAAENGVTQQAALPPWLRGDADPVTPLYVKHADLDAPKRLADLERDREEKRLFYVAITRARTRLVLSSAHWYAGTSQPQGLSPFYRLLETPTLAIRETHRSDPALQDPAIDAMQRRHARYRAEMALHDGDTPAPLAVPSRSVSRTTPIAKRMAKRNVHARDQGALFFSTVGTTASPPPQIPLPTAFATTALSTYARCPRRFFWTSVQLMPRRSSEAARIGTEVHRWIEQRANGQLSLVPLGDSVLTQGDTGNAGTDTGTEGVVDGSPDAQLAPGRAARARSAFRSSRFAELDPRHVEMPFSLMIAGRVVRGRIDAIYGGREFERHLAEIEIVDFKTGYAPIESISFGPNGEHAALADDDPTTLQLDVYGLVATRILGFAPHQISVTACYLGSGNGAEYRTRRWSELEASAAEARIIKALESIADRRFEPDPGPWCDHCDFSGFCEGAAQRSQNLTRTNRD